jgi:hypothetical protein
MNGIQILLLVIGVIMIFSSLLNFNEKLSKKSIKYFSELKGVQPQITNKTMTMVKIQGYFFFVLGLIFALLGIFLCVLSPEMCALLV